MSFGNSGKQICEQFFVKKNGFGIDFLKKIL